MKNTPIPKRLGVPPADAEAVRIPSGGSVYAVAIRIRWNERHTKARAAVDPVRPRQCPIVSDANSIVAPLIRHAAWACARCSRTRGVVVFFSEAGYNTAMRFGKLQFSLKWLLLGFAAIAIGLYLFYVYPTQKAERLVAAINRGDVHPYDIVERPQTFYFTNPQRVKITNHKTAVALLPPRTWSDVWHARRRIAITMTWSLDNPKYALEHQTQLLSTLTGFHMYSWNEREIRLPTK